MSMKNQTRELLVTTKAAQTWQEDFDRNIEELMSIVSRVDTPDRVNQSTEVLDVYHSRSQSGMRPTGRRIRKASKVQKPFEFLAFCN